MNTKTEAGKGVVIFIDQQQFKLDDRLYTARELLTLAGEDPNETTLVRKRGHQLEKLMSLDEPIELKNGEHFAVVHNGPTPVS